MDKIVDNAVDKVDRMDSLFRELRFALRDRVVLFGMIAVALLATYSLVNGLKESAAEQATITCE